MTTFPVEPKWVDLGPSRSGRDINDGPVYAPDGTFACGDPDCYSCWPEGPPNTVAYSAGAVCCPGEITAKRHERRGYRATWWEWRPSWRETSDASWPPLDDERRRRWTR